ncbi:MAG TPA: hypothetical protein ENG74_02905 [Thermoplasmatales archaeon]|nr:hypothetical protein [Thermoplasmatales archaeon]
MDYSAVDVFGVAPLAPLAGILLFWFIQLLFIESLKYGLSKIWENHKALCRFSNFMGIFFQALAHALGYTLTGIGVAEFSLSVSEGRVVPKKEKKGFPEWLANLFLSVGPFFVPPLIIFCIVAFMPDMLSVRPLEGFTFSENLISFGSLLSQFGFKFLAFLVNLDLFNPFHLGFLLLFLIVGLGIRPSYIGEENRRIGMLHDLSMIKRSLIKHPVYLLIGFVSLYILSYISLFLNIPIYVIVLSFFGWLSVISIVALLFAHFIVGLIWISDRLPSYKRFIPFSSLVLFYIIIRAVFSSLSLPYQYTVPLLLSPVVSLVSSFILLRIETNKLKSTKIMRQLENLSNLEGKDEGEGGDTTQR